jgi:hypothetical protein
MLTLNQNFVAQDSGLEMVEAKSMESAEQPDLNPVSTWLHINVQLQRVSERAKSDTKT